MPDPLRQTISATESSALFDASPYTTRWMLYRRFADGQNIDSIAHARMDWGLKLEPLIIAQAAEDLALEVRPNRGEDGAQVYVRHGLLGCTRDADIFCPSRGPGVLETKCVFDYRIWMQDWNGGNNPPKHHEIQIQQQMLVGPGGDVGGRIDRSKSYQWGVEAVWIAGELIYFERKPIPKFWDALEDFAAEFFDDLKNEREPDPFGETREFPILADAFPIQEKLVLDLREDPAGVDLAQMVRMYEYHRQQRLGHSRAEESIKFKLRVAAKQAGTILMPQGIIARLKDNKTGIGIKVHVPEDVQDGELTPFENVETYGG